MIEDAEGRGPSWARNRGLDRATGEYVFFCDDDDEVEKDFFRRPAEELARTGADFCLFGFAGFPESKRETVGNAEVRERYLPAFFGYSFDDVRRWNLGGRLDARKKLGFVWRTAFRRKFLEQRGLRFNEGMAFNEDAAFLANAAVWAEKVVSVPDQLYVYHPQLGGGLASGYCSIRHWDYKLKALEFRRRLDRETDGRIWKYCEASAVFSVLEMMHRWKKMGVSRVQYEEDLGVYLSDRRVMKAVMEFPVSWSHPLVRLAVQALRRRLRKDEKITDRYANEGYDED